MKLVEVKYDYERKVNKPQLKRIVRTIAKLIDGKIDPYESNEADYSVDSYLSFDDAYRILEKKYGEPMRFPIPEFKVPWMRWEIEGVWVILKNYSGEAVAQIVPVNP